MSREREKESKLASWSDIIVLQDEVEEEEEEDYDEHAPKKPRNTFLIEEAGKSLVGIIWNCHSPPHLQQRKTMMKRRRRKLKKGLIPWSLKKVIHLGLCDELIKPCYIIHADKEGLYDTKMDDVNVRQHGTLAKTQCFYFGVLYVE